MHHQVQCFTYSHLSINMTICIILLMASENCFMLQKHLSSCFMIAIKADLLRASACEKVIADFATEKSRRKMKGVIYFSAFNCSELEHILYLVEWIFRLCPLLTWHFPVLRTLLFIKSAFDISFLTCFCALQICLTRITLLSLISFAHSLISVCVSVHLLSFDQI